MTEYTATQLTGLLAEKYGPDAVPDVAGQLNGWLARGDGVAVYENHDLGHQDLGDVKIASFGSPAAMLEDTNHSPNPPQRLPDGLPAGHINWRYTLVGTYRGAPLPLEVPHHV
jgi:hypothetical protein